MIEKNYKQDFPMALEPPAGLVVTITHEMVQRAVEASRISPRKRVILPLHKTEDSPLHRMLNAGQPGTYIRPHWHRQPPKDETLVVLQGAIGLFVFHDDGKVQRALRLAAGSSDFGVDIVAGVCHTFIVLAQDTVVYEVKPGPYMRAMDKDFAAWAPAEGDPEVAGFINRLSAYL